MKIIAPLSAILLVAGRASATNEKQMENKKDSRHLRNLKKYSKHGKKKGHPGMGSCPENYAAAEIEFSLFDDNIVFEATLFEGDMAIEGEDLVSGERELVVEDSLVFVGGSRGIAYTSSYTYARNLCLSTSYCYSLSIFSFQANEEEAATYSVSITWDGALVFSSGPTTGVPDIDIDQERLFGACST
mmetsp:Transcript_35242/g.77182  ORF Transcript_35242/g.77182 Transcript_35242/m.77182 type:complete len:187 (-) Transcript_35242:175-735(-)|eukprot:CAMPEP_0178492182 /NCGR_PEP_ID=MMETSP0696-20121128/11798_1 /TAXON_ID=265572 /ORGANISM="Extubocellulus spinifer, Strain CCMP396" /LENGTH=186 /DNA_ID=CAMNT_0020120083 /DNA_START=34 /DNA_END=594 /DNA_ORIENTATION=-